MNRLLCILFSGVLCFASAQHANLSSGTSEEFFILSTATESVNHDFIVPGGLESLYVGLAYENGVAALLTNPAGIAMAADAEDTDGMQFLIQDPDAGHWTLTLLHDQSEERAAILEIFHNGRQAPRAGLLVDYAQFHGKGVTLSVALFSGEQPIPGANVTIDIQRGTEPTTSVSAHDNGDTDNADALAGDGLYSAFVMGLEPGFYMAIASATLEDGSTIGSSEFFQVFPVTGTLTGVVNDAPVDDDGDSLIDRIELTFGVDITIPGGYGASALLRASNGNEIWTSNGFAELDVDSTEITSELSAETLKKSLGVDGPYELKSVRLRWMPRGPSPMITHTTSEFLDHGWTQPYELSKLTRAYMTFTHYLGDEGIDLNGNGLFDVIRVSFEFDSALAETFDYKWNARLIPVTGLPADGRESFAQNTGPISFGLNTLTIDFPVEEYGLNGVSGPYEVSQLSLYPSTRLPGAYGQTDGDRRNPKKPRVLGITQAYSASQLEGGLPGTIPSLIQFVRAMPITSPDNSENALRAQFIDALQDAQIEANNGRTHQASNQLDAFLNKIDAQAGKAVRQADAAICAEAVRVILQNL